MEPLYVEILKLDELNKKSNYASLIDGFRTYLNLMVIDPSLGAIAYPYIYVYVYIYLYVFASFCKI